jgi:hypothetical protein
MTEARGRVKRKRIACGSDDFPTVRAPPVPTNVQIELCIPRVSIGGLLGERGGGRRFTGSVIPGLGDFSVCESGRMGSHGMCIAGQDAMLDWECVHVRTVVMGNEMRKWVGENMSHITSSRFWLQKPKFNARRIRMTIIQTWKKGIR